VFLSLYITRKYDPETIARILQSISRSQVISSHTLTYTRCQTSWCVRLSTLRSPYCKNCQNSRNVKRCREKKKTVGKSGGGSVPDSSKSLNCSVKSVGTSTKQQCVIPSCPHDSTPCNELCKQCQNKRNTRNYRIRQMTSVSKISTSVSVSRSLLESVGTTH